MYGAESGNCFLATLAGGRTSERYGHQRDWTVTKGIASKIIISVRLILIAYYCHRVRYSLVISVRDAF